MKTFLNILKKPLFIILAVLFVAAMVVAITVACQPYMSGVYKYTQGEGSLTYDFNCKKHELHTRLVWGTNFGEQNNDVQVDNYIEEFYVKDGNLYISSYDHYDEYGHDTHREFMIEGEINAFTLKVGDKVLHNSLTYGLVISFSIVSIASLGGAAAFVIYTYFKDRKSEGVENEETN